VWCGESMEESFWCAAESGSRSFTSVSMAEEMVVVMRVLWMGLIGDDDGGVGR